MHPTSIITAVADRFCVTAADIIGPRRSKAIAEARHITCIILRESTRLSYPEIGTLLGRRDHQSIQYSVKKAGPKLLRENPDIAAIYKHFTSTRVGKKA